MLRIVFRTQRFIVAFRLEIINTQRSPIHHHPPPPQVTASGPDRFFFFFLSKTIASAAKKSIFLHFYGKQRISDYTPPRRPTFHRPSKASKLFGRVTHLRCPLLLYRKRPRIFQHRHQVLGNDFKTYQINSVVQFNQIQPVVPVVNTAQLCGEIPLVCFTVEHLDAPAKREHCEFFFRP